jgi:dipeptidyl aminopeptidase/acylaminoacyl peptidase
VFAPPDYVLFVRQDTLFAQRLDLRQLTLVGDPVAVTERVARHPRILASVALSASAAGPLAYRTDPSVPRQLVWLDRSGKHTGTVGEPDADEPDSPRLSHDGRTVALRRTVSGNRDVWLIDPVRGVRRRFTFDAAAESGPIWSPDGSRIAFHAARKGGALNDLYLKPVSGPGSETLLLETSENKNIQDWSPDGRFILYSNFSQKPSVELWALPLDGDGKPFKAVQTGSSAAEVGRFSPDGRWIAYDSNETGVMEVYVQPFPGPGRSWQVSTNGGTVPQWRGDGREIFYRGPDDRLMSVPVTLQANGASVDLGTPVALFTMRLGSQYVASADGQRFLINAFVGDASTLPITIMLNWTAGLKK